MLNPGDFGVMTEIQEMQSPWWGENKRSQRVAVRLPTPLPGRCQIRQEQYSRGANAFLIDVPFCTKTALRWSPAMIALLVSSAQATALVDADSHEMDGRAR